MTDANGIVKHSLSRKIDRWTRMGRHGVMARLSALAGRHERLLLEQASLIRLVREARESMQSYRRVDELVRRHPAELAAYEPGDQQPEGFVLFVGNGRSGHSLVASLLDAHPNVVVSHELHALRQLQQGHSFAEVVQAIKYNSLFFERLGRSNTGYDYAVPGQYQGRAVRLMLIGDKKGNGTTRLLRSHPGLWDFLEESVPVPFFLVHVIRHPYDNIASKAQRRGTSLAVASRSYFANVETVQRLKRGYPDRIRDVYLDDLLSHPHETLTALLRSLGVSSISESYLSSCASILFERPRRTSRQVSWDPGLHREIEARLGAVEFLRRFAS